MRAAAAATAEATRESPLSKVVARGLCRKDVGEADSLVRARIFDNAWSIGEAVERIKGSNREEVHPPSKYRSTCPKGIRKYWVTSH